MKTWFSVNVEKSKNRVRGGINNRSEVTIIVIVIIKGTSLFVYFKVVKTEK